MAIKFKLNKELPDMFVFVFKQFPEVDILTHP